MVFLLYRPLTACPYSVVRKSTLNILLLNLRCDGIDLKLYKVSGARPATSVITNKQAISYSPYIHTTTFRPVHTLHLHRGSHPPPALAGKTRFGAGVPGQVVEGEAVEAIPHHKEAAPRSH